MGVHQSPEVYAQIKELLGIPEDEPIFILRAQDKFTPKTLELYLDLERLDSIENTDALPAWRSEVNSVLQDCFIWQNKNREKVKRPD